MAAAVLAMMVVFGGAFALVGGLVFGVDGAVWGACIGAGIVVAVAASVF